VTKAPQVSVEQRIVQLFKADPDAAYFLTELCALVYKLPPKRIEEKHRKSVARACRRLVERFDSKPWVPEYAPKGTAYDEIVRQRMIEKGETSPPPDFYYTEPEYAFERACVPRSVPVLDTTLGDLEHCEANPRGVTIMEVPIGAPVFYRPTSILSCNIAEIKKETQGKLTDAEVRDEILSEAIEDIRIGYKLKFTDAEILRKILLHEIAGLKRSLRPGNTVGEARTKCTAELHKYTNEYHNLTDAEVRAKFTPGGEYYNLVKTEAYTVATHERLRREDPIVFDEDDSVIPPQRNAVPMEPQHEEHLADEREDEDPDEAI
jgi:hypothetical protein